MACGCTIVTTTACSLIEHEVHGLVSPIEDAGALAENLGRVVADPQLKAALTRASLDFVKKFDIKQGCLKIESILQSLITG
jgi:glycosyltransferase involved in cell wall biosynthesis